MKTIYKIGIALVFLCVCLHSSAQTKEGLVRRGNKQYAEKNYSEAIEKYKASLEQEYNEKAMFNLGDTYYKQGNFEEAIKCFKTLIEENASTDIQADAHYNIGNCLVEQKKYNDAFEEYKKCLKLNPNDNDARYNLEYCRAHLVKSKIIVVQPEHGSVYVKEKEAYSGQQINISATPDERYVFSRYIVVNADNQSVSVNVSGDRFIMPGFDVLVSAEFKQQHRIEIEKNIKNGKVRVDKIRAAEGQQVKLSCTGDDGYLVDKITVYKTGNRKKEVEVKESSFQMPDYDVTVTATFRKAYKVNVDKVSNGKISVSDSLAQPGKNVAVVVKPEKGFQLADLSVESKKDPNTLAPVSDDNVFQMIDDDVLVKASFEEATDYYKIAADTATKNGQIVLKQSEATYRETVMLNNKPKQGYKLKEYVIHQAGDTAVHVQSLGNCFTMPSFDVEVSGIFEKNDDQNQQQDQKQNQQQQDQKQDQQQQDQKNQQQQNQQQDQQQDQQQQDQEQQQDKNKNKDKEQQNNQQQQGQQGKEQEQEVFRPQEHQISKEDAENMLKALEIKEKETAKRLNRKTNKRKIQKDW